MNFEDMKIKEIMQKALESNIIKIDSSDIAFFKTQSNELSLKPIKNRNPVGVMIYFELSKKNTIDDFNKKADAIVTSLPNDANIVWAANKGNTKRLITKTIYLY